MKRILSILGTITLIGTSTTSLVACDNNFNTEYTQEQLKELKKENKISINGNTLEWMAPQDKSFNKVDNKWYFVIWRGDKNHDWRIVKFKHTELKLGKIIDKYDNYYTLELREDTGYPFPFILSVRHSSFLGPTPWEYDNGTYFKNVYRWDGEREPNTLIIDSKTGEINEINKEVKEVEVKEDK